MVTPSITAQRIQDARQRAMETRRQDYEQKKRMLLVSSSRREEAKERRELIGDQKTITRVLCWAAMVQCALSAKSFATTVVESRKDEVSRHKFHPHIAIFIRRPLRRARLKLYGGNAQRPTLAGLRFDKLLNLFSDAQLNHSCSKFFLRYYFLNETIIFMGSEDDEAYVLAEGTADVMMGQTCVFTMKAGMSFGTVGMITGEPRTASIVARSHPCLVWCIKRKEFEAYKSSNDSQVQKAHEMIAELRESNLRNVYKNLMKPSFLRTFPTLANVGDDLLTTLIQSGRPRVIPTGEVYTSAMSSDKAPHMFLLRGTFRISVARRDQQHFPSVGGPGQTVFRNSGEFCSADTADGHHHEISVTEQVMRFVELPLRHANHEERTIVRLVAAMEERQRQQRARGEAAEGGVGGASNSDDEDDDLQVDRSMQHEALASTPFVMPIGGGAAMTATPPLGAVRMVPSPPPVGSIGLPQSAATIRRRQSTFRPKFEAGRTKRFLMDLKGPLMLNIATIFLQEHNSPFVVEALGSCDIMSWSKKSILDLDILELAVIRQNAYNLHCPFMPKPKRETLLQALFPAELWHINTEHLPIVPNELPPWVPHLKHVEQLPITRWVFAQNDFVSFRGSEGMELLIVLSGELEGHGRKMATTVTSGSGLENSTELSGGSRRHHHHHHHLGGNKRRDDATPAPPKAFLWPTLPHVYFGCSDLVSRVTSPRLEAIKIQRSDLLK